MHRHVFVQLYTGTGTGTGYEFFLLTFVVVTILRQPKNGRNGRGTNIRCAPQHVYTIYSHILSPIKYVKYICTGWWQTLLLPPSRIRVGKRTLGYFRWTKTDACPFHHRKRPSVRFWFRKTSIFQYTSYSADPKIAANNNNEVCWATEPLEMLHIYEASRANIIQKCSTFKNERSQFSCVCHRGCAVWAHSWTLLL